MSIKLFRNLPTVINMILVQTGRPPLGPDLWNQNMHVPTRNRAALYARVTPPSDCRAPWNKRLQPSQLSISERSRAMVENIWVTESTVLVRRSDHDWCFRSTSFVHPITTSFHPHSEPLVYFKVPMSTFKTRSVRFCLRFFDRVKVVRRYSPLTPCKMKWMFLGRSCAGSSTYFVASAHYVHASYITKPVA